MKKLNWLFLAGLCAFYSCASDDAPTAELEHEHELITTVIVELESGEGHEVELIYFDEDADGEDFEAEITGGTLWADTTYTGTVEILNESEHHEDEEEEEEGDEHEHEGEDVTEEIIEENTVHQFFYTADEGLNVTVDGLSLDDNDNVFGLDFTLTTGAASTGDLNVTLLHEPTKPNTSIEDAEGEADFDIDFPIVIEVEEEL